MNPYTTLGLSSNCNQDELKAAYRKLVKEYHPDVNKNPEAEKRIKEINAAYKKLLPIVKRRIPENELKLYRTLGKYKPHYVISVPKEALDGATIFVMVEGKEYRCHIPKGSPPNLEVNLLTTHGKPFKIVLNIVRTNPWMFVS